MNFPTLDKCPGHNLYIGGFIALRRPKALHNCHITHIVSVMDWQFDEDNPMTRGFQHLHIPVDDVEDENLLRWFPQSNAFIHKGLSAQPPNESLRKEPSLEADGAAAENGVFIHCAMGKSRSATVLIAYLLWQSRQPRPTSKSTDNDSAPLPQQPLSVVEALTQLRQGRAICEPNEGFMDQLYLYADMGCPTTSEELESHKFYRRFMNKRSVAESLAVNQAPDVGDIRFEDDTDDDPPSSRMSQLRINQPQQSDKIMEEVAPGVSAPTGQTTSQQPMTRIRCRRCRHVLATTPHLIEHETSRSDPASQPCAHIFLHPLSWMRETLAGGELEGRLTCPNKKCGVNVGKFAWQGLRCSCGGWVTPAFAAAKGRVDEVPEKAEGSSSSQNTTLPSGGGAIRLPPGMRGRDNGNL